MLNLKNLTKTIWKEERVSETERRVGIDRPNQQKPTRYTA